MSDFNTYWKEHYGKDIQNNSKPINVARYVFNDCHSKIQSLEAKVKELEERLNNAVYEGMDIGADLAGENTTLQKENATLEAKVKELESLHKGERELSTIAAYNIDKQNNKIQTLEAKVKELEFVKSHEGNVNEGYIKTLEALLIEACERLSKSLTDKTPEGFYDNELKISMFLNKPEIKKLRGKE